MIELNEPYAPRPIRSLGRWTEAGMRLKVHGLECKTPSDLIACVMLA